MTMAFYFLSFTPPSDRPDTFAARSFHYTVTSTRQQMAKKAVGFEISQNTYFSACKPAWVHHDWKMGRVEEFVFGCGWVVACLLASCLLEDCYSGRTEHDRSISGWWVGWWLVDCFLVFLVGWLEQPCLIGM